MENLSSYSPEVLLHLRQTGMSVLLNSEHHQCHIVVKVSLAKFGHRRHDLFPQSGGRERLAGHQQLLQTVFAKLIAGSVPCFSDTVREKHKVVAAADVDFMLRISLIRKNAEHRATLCQTQA